jgi:hypothetical protein
MPDVNNGVAGMPRNCPKCDALMEHQADDPSVGIVGHWVCTNDDCGEVVEDDEDDYDVDYVRG